MKRFLMAFALGAFVLVAPAALADTVWVYSINGTNFSANIDFYVSSTPVTVDGPVSNGQGGYDQVSAYVVDAASGSFTNPAGNTYTFGISPTVAANGASAYNLADNGAFVYDNLIYPTLSGNDVLDWGSVLIAISDAPGLPSNYELNLYAGGFGSGAPGNGFFYFADNGSYYSNNAILNVDGGPAQDGLRITPEPESLMLFGSGLLGLAGVLRWKALRTAANRA